MSKTIEFEGRTEQEAVAKACSALSLAEDKLDYTMLDEGSSGVFGLGARPVRIRVRAPEESQAAATNGTGEGDSAEGGGVVGPAPEKAARALEVAQGLADRMGLESKIEVRDDDEQIVVTILEQDGSTAVADMLGRCKPPAIPSFQFLLNKIVNRFPEDRKHIIVEVPSVPRKERKEESRSEGSRAAEPPKELDPDLDPALVELARMLAERAQSLGKVITVHPMLSGDRRAIHQTIMTVDGAQTVSQGEGLYRRMHIVPDELSDRSKKKRRRRRRRRRRKEDGEGSESQASEAAEAAEASGENEVAADVVAEPAVNGSVEPEPVVAATEPREESEAPKTEA